MQEIGETALWVAGMRALETERPNPLFRDPFARRLAGDSLVEELKRRNVGENAMPPAIEVRTRWLDDQINLGLGRGIRQIVILAAGMDARAYRLAWPGDTRLFELDHGAVLEDKEAKLSGITPKCQRHAVAVDLAEDWPAALKKSGFNPEAPTLWLIEGLLVYLTEEQVALLMARVNALSAPESVALIDVVGRSILDSSRVKLMHNLARQFGTDEPEALLQPIGWAPHVYTTAAVGKQLGRWPFPVAPRGTPGVPQGYLVHGVKR
ncbi:SAM-dependent methyltransferase [Corallococcus sp. AS-1-6]|uniref:SAM-dependent methyltransferase n=1 Tax=Corallococcus sp. AS-1-6 TaxID=2874599 RepID=UPI001CBCE93B|nr:SAM-dependent methyltransferase [Corallococcus sp. AS-1-6]